ncbi:hypothetical protein C2869_15725 [Saccharobesus litoralis]|uniref:Haloacid dehalogenase-like hydrolase n=1 Tax=Saccharobesus litoralis TaxID=2172099 RepID=A0A2S0VU82_9ALTE|nr:hypothetical protein [Saccharobesus litoralis]AWB67784.1 hypothetical protein C2869_15725 [Saccharobesus litoralis]
MTKCDLGQYELISFDIFDTLVFRTLPKPEDVFAKSYRLVKNELQLPYDDEEFVALRKHAESLARQQSLSSETMLKNIYDCLPFTIDVREKLLLAELQVESQVCFVPEESRALLISALKSAANVVFISDMYLTATQIRNYIFKNDKQLSAIPIYVSCEHSASKFSRKLFAIVREAYSVDFNRWLHMGDNDTSDIQSAASFGIQTRYYNSQLDTSLINALESRDYGYVGEWQYTRKLSITKNLTRNSVSFELACFTWGPILFGFIDWVIDKTIQAGLGCILCLMREGETFYPLLKRRLSQRNITSINLEKLYASRKSTFWASIDLTQADWKRELVASLIKVQGYKIRNFYNDFNLVSDSVYEQFGHIDFKEADSTYLASSSLFDLVIKKINDNQKQIAKFIQGENTRFKCYYKKHITTPLSDCVIVDLGYGGTAQHQIEKTLKEKSGLNLLFYSTERINRFFSETQYLSFVGIHNQQWANSYTLARSPECIEALLLGNVGTTLGYTEDGEPILGKGVVQNQSIVAEFLSGLLAFFDVHYEYSNQAIPLEQIQIILARFINYPTYCEADLYSKIYHEDNFGADGVYPIISQDQVDKVKKMGVDAAYLKFKQNLNWYKSQLFWPQALMMFISKSFLHSHSLLKSSSNQNLIEELVAKVEQSNWQFFAIYGAGDIGEQFIKALEAQNVKPIIERIVDRRASVSGDYQLNGYCVTNIENALKQGSRQFVITSFAFKNEIALSITKTAKDMNINNIDLISI